MQKTTLPHYKNIVFPEHERLINFLNGRPSTVKYEDYHDAREKNCITLRQFRTRNLLKAFGMQENEIGLVLKKCPQLIFYEADARKIADIYFKNGYNLEEIFKRLFTRPDTFLFSQKDFEKVNDESVSFDGKNIF